MIQPPVNFITLDNKDEKISYYKKNGLLAQTKNILPHIFYNGVYTDYQCTLCDIVGYVDNTTCVIKINDNLHCIHIDYLKQMQKQDDLNCISEYKGKRLNYYVDEYIVFDIETTDINSKECFVIEISAIHVVNDKIIDTFSELVNPQVSISKAITKLTGITNEMVQNAESINSILPKFLNFIGNRILVGHNITTYDINVLNTWCKRLNINYVSNDYIDTYYIARNNYCDIDVENYKLCSLCKYFGIQNLNAHRALSDVYATYELYKKLFNESTLDDNTEECCDSFEIDDEEQLAFFSDDKFEAETLKNKSNKILIAAQNQLSKFNAKPNDIKVIQGKNKKGEHINSFSLRLISMFLLRFQFKNNKYIHLEIKESLFKSIIITDIAEIHKIDSMPDFVLVDFNSDCDDLYRLIEQAVDYGYNNYVPEETFGCCSKYLECSNQRKCIHDDLLYSKACSYRSNLEKGNIFYGINRNV